MNEEQLHKELEQMDKYAKEHNLTDEQIEAMYRGKYMDEFSTGKI